ncbi:nucleoside diphosphate kinase regulator [Massilia sp. CCM 8734]|uniref:nucleoside diphosphate kinase regulator n=1 Tax=Massilia sp. CCM 8734 TaxID=2609283 RepID=UPI00141E7CCC|nr:nucleoside diphosphate kinase regulator [Massilia sp. CCM 8734]NHZ94333.1 nucleoside diphosphate kinase regulator [Massilia sp. CCM 8734]
MRPNIIVSSVDMQRLETLLDSLPAAQSDVKNVLLDELARAELVEPEAMPPDVVTMNSRVRFSLDAPAEEFSLTLAYPKDMQPDGGHISILSPVGNALIGLAVGDSIDWHRPDGASFQLTVLDVLYQPERSGELHR